MRLLSEWRNSAQAAPMIVDWQGRLTLDLPWVNWELSIMISLRRHVHGPLAKRLMHIAHKSGNTSGVSKNRHRIGWIIQWKSLWIKASAKCININTGFPGDVCVCSLIFRMEAKMPWCQTTSRKMKTVTMSAYQDHLNAGFSKVCKILKVCGIES